MRELALVAVALVIPLVMANSCERGGMAPTVHICKSYTDQVACENDAACQWTDNQECKAK